MNKKELLLKRLDEIGQHLSSKGDVLALWALGSCGVEIERLDQYSDLDFFVICKEGSKPRYLENTEWLNEVHPLVYSFKNSRDGYKVMYEDDVFCEFAIFEPHEMLDIKGMKGRLVWHAKDFDVTLCELEPLPTYEVNVNHCLNEALTNLYIGLGRYHRGEKLSAHHFICSYTVNHVITLVTTLETPTDVTKDPFSVPRRFEARYPAYEVLLSEILTSYDETPKAAKHILMFLDEHFEINQILKQRILTLCES